jgi:hypothetical protein
MKKVTVWKVIVALVRSGKWRATFTFKPSRDSVVLAINNDIEDMDRELEHCDRGDADGIYSAAERMRNAQDVVLHADKDFADVQVQARVKVAGTLIGTIQATRDRVWSL